MNPIFKDPVFYCISSLILVYVWLAYRWSKRNPAPVCPICHGTRKVPNEQMHFVDCSCVQHLDW